MKSLEVLFSPAEFAALAALDLSMTTCVVFDVLRATSSMAVALDQDARAVVPVAGIPEALAIRSQNADVLCRRAGGHSHSHRTHRERRIRPRKFPS
jgi:2-phosphosulfolactate phosphatase